MQTLQTLLQHFAAVFSLMLLYYFLPVLLFYYLFYIKYKGNWQHLKIQAKHPGSRQIRRELNYSLVALLIFSVAGLFMYESAMRGNTNMYFEIGEYGLPYFFLSLLLNIFANDTIFYWVHRFMHLKWVFPHVHLVHHKSTSPTPFAVLAFHPIEAIMHGTVYILLLFVIPIHPVMFGVFHLYNLLTNVAGHGGFEFMPEKLSRHWFFNWQNTVTNHDVHHKKFNCNYGNYFVLWDKLMNTTDKKKEVRKNESQPTSAVACIVKQSEPL
jgi:sterol desaturase/sphingolipid hydroxylase (fatty acid hydroxylase superfamily)